MLGSICPGALGCTVPSRTTETSLLRLAEHGVSRRESRIPSESFPAAVVLVERPAYNVTVFKAHYGKMTLKIYSKGERVLRIEVIVHNTKAYRRGRSLTCFPEIVNQFKGILERFVDALNCINVCFISDQTLERLPEPAQIGRTKVGVSTSISPECGGQLKQCWHYRRRLRASRLRTWPDRPSRAAANKKPNTERGAPPMTLRNSGRREWFARSRNHAVMRYSPKVFAPSMLC
jgi:hypothetical protein